MIRNEDVFIEKVRERVALAEAVGHLLSPVLLLQTGRGAELHAALAAACDAAGAPAATDLDQAGRTHAIWPLGPGATQDRLARWPAAASWSSPTATTAAWPPRPASLPRFLAVITTPGSVAIQPYNRLVSELTSSPAELLDALRAAGAEVTRRDRPRARPRSSLYTAGEAHAVTLPHDSPALSPVDNLDHALVERVILRDALGLEPGRQADHVRGWRLPGRRGSSARSTPGGRSWPS